jgi:hypothetical protein
MTGVHLFNLNNETDIFKIKDNLHLHQELPKATEAITGAKTGGAKTHWCIQALTVFASPSPAKERHSVFRGEK